jgi:Mak10 subunit, NatC N(alpha)-terminal acetyltransferase
MSIATFHDFIVNDDMVDITTIIVDCATNDLNEQEPFLCNSNYNDDQRKHQQASSTSTVDTIPVDHAHSSNMDEFNLQDAMAATQLMDPKMDCCEIPVSVIAPWLVLKEEKQQEPEGDNKKKNNAERMIPPRPIPTGLNDPMASLPWDELTIVDASVICIELLIRFQALLSGSSVGESIFTCLYAHCNVLAEMHSRLCHNCGTTTGTPTTTAATTNSSSALQESIQQLTLNDSDTSPTTTSSSSSEHIVAQWSIFACTYAMVDLTETIREIVFNADIYEEEDFAINTHNLQFYPSSIHTKVFKKSQQQGNISLGNTSNNDANNSSNETIDGEDDNDDNGKLMDSLNILETAKQFLHQLSSSTQYKNNEPYITIIDNIIGYEFNLLQLFPIIARLCSGPELHATIHTLRSVIGESMEQLSDIQTIVTAKVTKDDIYNIPTVKTILRRSFDSFIIRPLVGNFPVRKISFLPPDQSISILCTITSELDTNVCKVLLVPTNSVSIQRLYRILDRICYSNILCRSILLLNLYFDEKIVGQNVLGDLISNDIWSTVGTNLYDESSPTAFSLHQQQQQFTEKSIVFINRLAKPIYDTFRVRFLTRQRQRTYIEMIMIPEWIKLQQEAQLFDIHYHNQQQQQQQQQSNGPKQNGKEDIISEPISIFTRYALMIQIRVMDRYIETGIEIGLFRNIVHDISFAYWYRDYLLSALHGQLSTIRQQQQQSKTDRTAAVNSTDLITTVKEFKSKVGHNKKKHHNNKNGKHHHYDDSRTTVKPVTVQQLQQPPKPTMTSEDFENVYELKVVSLKRHLCRKTIQYISLLRKVGIIKEQSSFEFTSYQQIFVKRFELFRSIQQPPVLSYEDYKDGIDSTTISTLNLIQILSDGYQYCRTMIDEMITDMIDHSIDPYFVSMPITELKSLIKICIGNMVYVQRVRQLLEKSKMKYSGDNHNSDINNEPIINANAIFDFDSHKQFCIIKVEEVI